MDNCITAGSVPPQGTLMGEEGMAPTLAPAHTCPPRLAVLGRATPHRPASFALLSKEDNAARIGKREEATKRKGRCLKSEKHLKKCDEEEEGRGIQ